MKKSYRFELCAETLEAAIAAQQGGADRLELCTDLRVSGLTPSPELLAATLKHVSIPVHVLIRPRAGDFVYSAEEFAVMAQQIDEAKAAGAAGIAIGILLPDGRIDVPRTRQLAERAHPMHITFHRAFDEAANLSEALEDVILSGADTLLTSGGAPNVHEGALSIGRLQIQAGDRLEIMAGGGLKLTNLIEVVNRSGTTTLHGSLSRSHAVASPEEAQQTLVEDIQEAIRLLQQECLEATS